MRLTSFKNRTAHAMAALALAASAGCQKLPYIDQSKAVPHDRMGTIEQEDREVKQATYLGTMPMGMPRLAKPRTTNDPEAQEIWPMTLQEAIKIGLDNSEVIRAISLAGPGLRAGGCRSGR